MIHIGSLYGLVLVFSCNNAAVFVCVGPALSPSLKPPPVDQVHLRSKRCENSFTLPLTYRTTTLQYIFYFQKLCYTIIRFPTSVIVFRLFPCSVQLRTLCTTLILLNYFTVVCQSPFMASVKFKVRNKR